MRVLVAGSAGMLAKDLVPVFTQRGHDVVAPSEAEFDIADPGIVLQTVGRYRPDLLINCAAYTAVDDAETEEDLALRINAYAVQSLCLACQEHNVPLVHFSTDYVFDGTKEAPYTIYDQPNPTTAYGRTKLLGEQYVMWLLTRFFLIRTAWLFGHHGKNFIETMLQLGSQKKQISVVNDQRGCPTWTRDLAEAAADLAVTGRYGVYHVTNSEPTTWYDFAVEIFRMAGTDVDVSPTTTDMFPRPAKRPANSVLDPYPLPQVIGREMPSWRQALKQYIEGRG
jgi:dTDP-4-dehydrorhamnose reductase